MKKAVYLSFFFTLIMLSLITCGPKRGSIISPVAENGILDLEGWDFTENGTIELSGNWKFIWLENDPSFSWSDFDDSGWDTFEVPNFWNDKVKSKNGYAWFRLKIIHIPVEESLSIYLLNAFSAYELYCNGKLILKNGVAGTTRTTTIPQRFAQFTDIDEYEEIVFAWKISNFRERFGGPAYGLKLGLVEDIKMNFLIIDYINFISFGIIMMMFIYHLLHWFFLRDDKASFYFSMFSLIVAVRIIAFNRYIEQIFSTFYLYEFTYRLEHFTMVSGLITFLLFFKNVFKNEFSDLIFKIIFVISFLFFIIIMVTPIWFSNEFILIYQIVLLLSSIWMIIMSIMAVKNRRPGSLILLSSFAFLVITVIIDVVASNLPSLPINSIQIGTIVVLFSQSFLLSNRFAIAYKTADHLSKNLQKEVTKQTRIIREKNDELIRLAREKTNYFVNLAHETKTPLTLIINYLNKYIKKKGTDYDLDIIKENIYKLKKNMVNFLDYEKLEKGQDFYNHDRVTDATTSLINAVRMFKESAQKKGIKLLSIVKKNIRIQIDPYAFDRIINNLLDNAVKYTEKGGSIEVELKSQKDGVILSVEDTGIGIPEEQLINIFKPYFQISHEKQNIQGIGMGLNITKKIIDDAQGKVNVKSRTGEGTKFTVWLKKYTGEETGGISVVKEKGSVPIKSVLKDIRDDKGEVPEKNTLLVIEDNPDMLAYLKEILQDDYNVFCARNGLEALNKTNSLKQLHLVISDIMMDVMNGYEFYEVFKRDEEYKSVPVIFLTAKNTQYERIRALKAGVVDFINKPFNIEELKAKIESIIKMGELLFEKSKKELIKQVITSLNSKADEDDFLRTFDTKCVKYDISAREKEIMLLIFKGSQYKEIAEKLFISDNTVKTHISHIYRKCNVQNKVELINLFKAP